EQLGLALLLAAIDGTAVDEAHPGHAVVVDDFSLRVAHGLVDLGGLAAGVDGPGLQPRVHDVPEPIGHQHVLRDPLAVDALHLLHDAQVGVGPGDVGRSGVDVDAEGQIVDEDAVPPVGHHLALIGPAVPGEAGGPHVGVFEAEAAHGGSGRPRIAADGRDLGAGDAD